MIIQNAKYCKDYFCNEDLYIFAIGYEHRSYYLLDVLLTSLERKNYLIFVFDDYRQYEHTRQKIEELEKCNMRIKILKYADSQKVQELICEAVENMKIQRESVTVHIDYSSMPRSWYCRMPMQLKNCIREEDKVYFWYTEGEYPASYEEYPSAGIDSFSFFSGKPSLQIDSNRVHVMALSYDAIRTEAIISITDPDYLVACYAYNPRRADFQKDIKSANSHILSRAAMWFSLHMDDFEFMLSKLRETANELLPSGDVILIPDGPKPLIFAMSLVPNLMNKDGLSCLHVVRNSCCFTPLDVMPTEVVYGFSMRKRITANPQDQFFCC